MTRLILIIVLAVVTVGCTSERVTLPTASDSMVLLSVSNVEISATDLERLLFLEACLEMETLFMEKKMEHLLDGRSSYFGRAGNREEREEIIDRIGKESRDALQSCLERR